MKKKAVVLKSGIFSGILLFSIGIVLCCIKYMSMYANQDRDSTSVEGFNIKEQMKIALTFDDGPHPVYTEQLLDGLLERNVKVTFFITGEHAKAYPDIVKRMSEEGHLIGNHTYSHLQLKNNNRELFVNELIKTNDIISEITGKWTEYVRPPYGSWDKSFEKNMDLFPVLWNIDPLDWCSTNVSAIVRRITCKVKENDIILMHDEYPSTVTAALKVIDELQEKGYYFVTVDELLFD